MSKTYSTIIYAVIVFILLNLVSNKIFTRFDFTQGQVYTLSPATSRIVGGLDKKIEIIAFVSEKLPPQAVSSKTQLVDKLTEFTNIDSGKLSVTFLDPVTDSEAENLASAFGVPPLDLQVIEKDQAQVIKAYFGLAITTPTTGEIKEDDPLSLYDKYEVMPVVENLNNLEFDLASSLLKVGSNELPTLAFLQGHGEHTFAMAQYLAAMNNDPRADYPVSEELNQNYNVKTIDFSTLDETAAADPFAGIDTLIIPGPQEEIPSEQITKIHQFIENGGNAIFLIDSMSVDTQYSFSASRLPVDYHNLLAPWKVNVETGIIADASHDMASFNQGYITYTLPYPFFVKVANLNQDNSITRDVETVTMPWISPLKIENDESVKIDVLAFTSSQYQVVQETEMTTPTEIDGEVDTQWRPIDLGPQQDFNLNSSQEPLPLIVLAQKGEGGQVIIASDSDFVIEGGSNLVLFYNMIDALTLGNDLIEIRSKGVTDRPLSNLSATQKDSIRWGITLGIPIAFILYGFYRRYRRQSKKIAT